MKRAIILLSCLLLCACGNSDQDDLEAKYADLEAKYEELAAQITPEAPTQAPKSKTADTMSPTNTPTAAPTEAPTEATTSHAGQYFTLETTNEYYEDETTGEIIECLANMNFQQNPSAILMYSIPYADGMPDEYYEQKAVTFLYTAKAFLERIGFTDYTLTIACPKTVNCKFSEMATGGIDLIDAYNRDGSSTTKMPDWYNDTVHIASDGTDNKEWTLFPLTKVTDFFAAKVILTVEYH